MTHDDLVKRAVRWLKTAIYAKNPAPVGRIDAIWYKPACGVAVPELVSGNYSEIPDAFGWTRDTSYLVECKANRSDFLKDAKKMRTGVGEFLFYMCPPDLIKLHELPTGWGLLYVVGRRVKVRAWPTRQSSFNARGERQMMYSLLRRVEKRGNLTRCLAPKWGGDSTL